MSKVFFCLNSLFAVLNAIIGNYGATYLLLGGAFISLYEDKLRDQFVEGIADRLEKMSAYSAGFAFFIYMMLVWAIWPLKWLVINVEPRKNDRK